MNSNTNETIQMGNNDMKQTKGMMMIKGNRKGNKSIGNETKQSKLKTKHIIDDKRGSKEWQIQYNKIKLSKETKAKQWYIGERNMKQ